LSLLNSVDSMVRFIDEVNHPAVRANIDISHLLLANVKPEELRRLNGKAIHVHISDCDGKVHGDRPPGRGVVPFEPYLREIKALGIDGALSIELEYSPEPAKIVTIIKTVRIEVTPRTQPSHPTTSSSTTTSAASETAPSTYCP
jgi:sugar phosphate isomerase/epimerase